MVYTRNMQKIIVAAKSDNRVIGKNNQLVWNMPADSKFFLSTIEGTYLLTGRRTLESSQGDEVFGPHREFVIITRNKNYQADNGKVRYSIEEGIETAAKDGAKVLSILGGAKIYEQSMDLADKMILTEIHGIFDGDTFFPEIDLTKWKETSRIRYEKDAENPYDYSFVVYERTE